jgi:hypothetical protein
MLTPSETPFCQCLYEIENNLPRTQYCFVACPEQFKIMRIRAEKEKSKDEKNENNK